MKRVKVYITSKYINMPCSFWHSKHFTVFQQFIENDTSKDELKVRKSGLQKSYELMKFKIFYIRHFVLSYKNCIMIAFLFSR